MEAKKKTKNIASSFMQKKNAPVPNHILFGIIQGLTG